MDGIGVKRSTPFGANDTYCLWSYAFRKYGLIYHITCESLVSQELFTISPLDLKLEAFEFHFHFSKRVKSKLISLFISRKE